ncbi:tumor necrosis factor receptor superfamily member 26-like isoform X2 [Cricetulus griseus]|uniref:Tumor necrosis factor receptor superfamily member 26-like isoform X2 n=2 Tax=Cricetulus griseus TaxID=10029 RepID=A0A9J7GR19_CRIGR|nr:tumor necrosis factor receptor superfamily member 26-like isoform X2 [Cricetulus griseus]
MSKIVIVCSVNSTSQCGTNEFQFDTLCCQLCPAGTYIFKQCQENHGKSECIPCESGFFMNHNNSESSCFRCSQCRDDQEEVSECFQTSDRECQCKQGTYCNSENCVERCLSCSSCPKDKVIRQCNATMNTLCEMSDSESGQSGFHCLCLPKALNIVVVIAAVIIIIAAVIIIIAAVIKTSWYFCKRGSLNSPCVPGEEIRLSSNTLTEL